MHLEGSFQAAQNLSHKEKVAAKCASYGFSGPPCLASNRPKVSCLYWYRVLIDMFLTPCSGGATTSTSAEKAAKYMSDDSVENASEDDSGKDSGGVSSGGTEDDSGKDSGGVSSGGNEDDSEWDNGSSVYFQYHRNSEAIDIVMQLLTEPVPQSPLFHLRRHLCHHMRAFPSFLLFRWQLTVPQMGIWLSWLQLALRQFLPIPKEVTKLPAAPR